MAGLILALALAAPLMGSSGPGDVIDVPSIPTEVLVKTTDPFAPKAKPRPGPIVPDPVTIPDDVSFSTEVVPVTVTLPPPPPPPPAPVAPRLPIAASRASSVERAAVAPNGQIPADVLCSVSWDSGARLRCDAAAGLEAAAAAGMPPVAMTSTYRSYADQVAVKRTRGGFAAAPGTSNHGHGVAIDISEPARSWLHRYGAAYGWVNPAWAKSEKFEPWHFEFVG